MEIPAVRCCTPLLPPVHRVLTEWGSGGLGFKSPRPDQFQDRRGGGISARPVSFPVRPI